MPTYNRYVKRKLSKDPVSLPGQGARLWKKWLNLSKVVHASVLKYYVFVGPSGLQVLDPLAEYTLKCILDIGAEISSAVGDDSLNEHLFEIDRLLSLLGVCLQLASNSGYITNDKFYEEATLLNEALSCIGGCVQFLNTDQVD